MAELTPESWTALLRWLDGDEGIAAERYESIRRRLTKLFSWRGCREPDRLADVAIDRVARRVAEGAAPEAADPYGYFYGVAMNVERESWRDPARRQAPLPLSLVAPSETDEGALARQQACAESCLETLAAADLALLRRYHDGEGRDGIQGRMRLAEELGVGINALRIRAFRLRKQMQECWAKCLAKSIRDSDRIG